MSFVAHRRLRMWTRSRPDRAAAGEDGRKPVSRVRVHMMLTLDGYVAGPHQSAEKPFGEGAERLQDWLFKLRSFREKQGMEGGEAGPSDDVIREAASNLGATVMGRNMFGGGPGPWPEEAWNGWWGENPPYHTPVFVLTHHARR